MRPIRLETLFVALTVGCGSGSTEGGSDGSNVNGPGGGSGNTSSAGQASIAGSGGEVTMGGSGGSGGETTRGANDCCTTSPAPGCSDDATEACICAMRPECCSGPWDAACVALVNEKHCEENVRACVCTDWQQAQCCDDGWGTFCEITAEQKCGATPACGGSTPPATPTNACCQESTSPGCADDAVEQCVCDLLPDCCTAAWDTYCVQLVREQHCSEGVRTCACEDWEQSGCCDTRWDDFCTIVAVQKCGSTVTCD
jgi:hypothetical protein